MPITVFEYSAWALVVCAGRAPSSPASTTSTSIITSIHYLKSVVYQKIMFVVGQT